MKYISLLLTALTLLSDTVAAQERPEVTAQNYEQKALSETDFMNRLLQLTAVQRDSVMEINAQCYYKISLLRNQPGTRLQRSDKYREIFAARDQQLQRQLTAGQWSQYLNFREAAMRRRQNRLDSLNAIRNGKVQ